MSADHMPVALVLLSVVFAAPAQGQGNPAKASESSQREFAIPPKDGEFRKNLGGGIGCMAVGALPKGDGYEYCLRLGAAKLGMEFYQLQTYLSDDKRIPITYITDPNIVNVSPDGVRTILIPLSATELGDKLRLQSYIVATALRSGQVNSLQVTGKPSEITDRLAFSGITLGATKSRLTDTLGLPSSILEVPKIKGVRWSYAPFPFSFELVDGTVYSIRIQFPDKDDLDKAFIPMRTLPN